MMSGMTQAKKPVATFRDRQIELNVPGGAQVLVWNRAVKQFDELATEIEALPKGAELSEDQSKRHRKALNRLSDMVFSLIDSEDDAEWLEDEILAEKIVDSDMIDLFGAFGDALKDAHADSDGTEVAKPKKRSSAQRVK